MTMSIKPPGFEPAELGPEIGGAENAHALIDASASEQVGAAELPSEAIDLSPSTVDSMSVIDLAQAVERGELSSAELIERLLATAVDQHAGLSIEGQGGVDRQDLEQHLRDALAEDPTLRTLCRDVGEDS